MSDDDFGPPQRGRGRRERRGGPVRPLGDAPRSGRNQPSGRATATATADDDFGPVQRGRGPRVPRPRLPARGPSRRRGGRRIGAGKLALLVIVAVIGLAAVLAILATVRMDRVSVDGLQSAGLVRSNVLVVGSDSREGLTDEELLDIGTHRVDGDRADTLFVLATNGPNAAMLALPRDLYVTRCDGQRARINSAAGDQLGGPSCLVQTVSAMTGLPISHYVELDFSGFIDVVDAVGGVTMTLEEPLVDRAAGADLPAGRQRLDGTEALSFVRSRQVGGDLGRIERQQAFLQALARRMASPTTLANPVRLVRTTNSGAAALTANRGFGPLGLTKLGLGVAGARGGMPTYTVPASPQTIGGAAVLVPNEPAADELYRSFADGSALRNSEP